jgi:hypothetical protein
MIFFARRLARMAGVWGLENLIKASDAIPDGQDNKPLGSAVIPFHRVPKGQKNLEAEASIPNFPKLPD